MNFDIRLDLAHATIAELHRQADQERLARLARASRERPPVVAAPASPSPRVTVPAAGA